MTPGRCGASQDGGRRPGGEAGRLGGEAEEPLPGGNVAGAVVRVGATVRRPATRATPAVQALLQHLADAGFDGSPRPLGVDEQGRQVVEYIPGQSAFLLPAMTKDELGRVGRLIRALHDAAASFVPSEDFVWDVLIPPDTAALVCHNDLAPWNLIRNDERWVFIDWDGAGPGSRLWDLAYASQTFPPLVDGNDPEADGPRLAALVDGYGLSSEQRRRLPGLIARHTRGMYDLLVEAGRTGRQPWARLYEDGHATHWGRSAAYVERHLDHWVRALDRL